MNEYADWHDAAMGGPLEDDGGVSLEEQRQQLLQHRERDAVLCLVDCRKQMFEPYRHEAEKREPSAEAHGASVKEELNAPGAKDAKDAHGHTPFGDAMRCVRTLYQTKVLTSDQDLLGLVLYNTTTHDPIFDTAGVSMVQPFQQLGVEHIQAVDSLVAAGTPSSAAYRQFARQYGHQPSSALANALWIAQHHFMQLRSPMIKYRRIFVFTDDDDPSRGDEILKKHCAARVVDLHSAGVSLEVFGLGFGIDAESAAKEEGHTACADEENVLQRGGGASGTAYDAPGTYPGTEQLFRQDHFWSPLLEHSIPRDPNAQEHPIAGGLHLHARPEVFAELLSAVGHTVHAQRPVLHYALRLGMNPSGGSVPTMAVSLYTPLVAATPPASTWLDGATNDVLFSRARLVVEPSHVDGAAPATEILRRDVHHAVVVGGQRLIFTPAERQKMRMAVAEGSQPGLSILCFKRYTDVVKHKHASQRSSFIYPNLSAGGPESVRLFVLLHRTLLRQGKVAIAQHRLRPTTAPRLVALIPSPPASDAVEDTHGGAPLVVDPVYATFPAASLPAEGLGLYLMPLPYADDLRAVSAVLPPEHAERAVPSSEGLELMAGIIRNLSVPFDIAAVPNPSLNRLRQTLESLVLPDIPPSDDVGHYYSVNDDRDGFDVPPPMEPQFEDLTLPDREGMAKFAHVFNDFNNHVLGGTSYDADRLCASAAAARSTATTRARTAPVVKAESKKAKVEETDDDIVSVVGRCAASNDWHRLTIPQLKEYLKQVGKSLGGARKKDELIALAQDAHSAQ